MTEFIGSISLSIMASLLAFAGELLGSASCLAFAMIYAGVGIFVREEAE